MITVVLADDHLRTRAVLRYLLSCEGDVVVVGEATHGGEVLDLVRTLQPRVLVSDVAMPGQTALQFLEGVVREHSEIRVVIVTNYLESPYLQHLSKAGAVAFVDKGSCMDHLVPAVRAAVAGERYVSPKFLECMS